MEKEFILNKWMRRGYRHIKDAINRIRLRNKNVTILAPTCIGGVICHHLGLKFNSPTVNLWMTEDDFYEFVMNLRWYVGQEVSLSGYDQQYGFPIGYIQGPDSDGIYINFNHHKVFDNAKEDWDRRKKRICWDNIFVISSTRGGESMECIMRWARVPEYVKSVVCFTAKPYPDITFSYQLKTFKKQACCGSYMVEGFSPILKLQSWDWEFDYTGWLNSGKIKKRGR